MHSSDPPVGLREGGNRDEEQEGEGRVSKEAGVWTKGSAQLSQVWLLMLSTHPSHSFPASAWSDLAPVP